MCFRESAKFDASQLYHAASSPDHSCRDCDRGADPSIGHGITEALVADGWSVVITDRQAERGKAFAEKLTAAGAEIEVVILDITEPEAPEKAVQAALKRFGRRDGLVTMRGSA